MTKARRHPEHQLILGGEPNSSPLPERRRTLSQIDCNIKDLASNHTHQLSLGLPYLKVNATKNITAGTGVIVLNKPGSDPGIGHLALIETFHEEAARIAEHSGFDD
jgi:hypothetical protein